MLHVDDDTDFLKLFSLFFKSKMDIESVNRPERVMEMLCSGDYDVLVTDYDMPGIDGLELLKRISRDIPGFPVIFYTGQGNEEIAREAFMSGASDYFTKDVTGFVHKEKFFNSVIRAVETQRMEKSEQQATRRYHNIFENIRDVYFETDLSGTILETSPSVMELMGYSPEEMMGKSFVDFFEDPFSGQRFISDVIRR